jgi:hypothetical protein
MMALAWIPPLLLAIPDLDERQKKISIIIAENKFCLQ